MIPLILILVQVAKSSASIKEGYGSLPIIPMSLYVYDPSNSGIFDEFKNFELLKTQTINNIKEQMKEYSKGSDEYIEMQYYLKLYEAIKTVVVSASTNDLGKIDKGTDLLIINQIGDGIESEPFDLSKLSGSMRIVHTPTSSRNSNRLSFESVFKAAYSSMLKNDDHSLLRFTNALMDLSKANSKSKNVKELENVYIKGDCKNKVSFISFTYGTIKFVESNFTANIFIGYAIINGNGKGIDSQYVMVASTTSIPNSLYPVRNLFLIVSSSFGSYGSCCGVKFLKDSVFIKNMQASICDINYAYSLLYSYAKEQIGFVSLFIAIDLEVASGVTKIPSFNISVQDYNVDSGIFDAKSLADGNIVVTQTGPWELLAEKPKIIVESLDPSKIEIDTSVKDLTIEKLTVIPYVPKSNKGLSVGAIVGIVIGCLAVVGIVVGVCVYFFVVKKKKAVENEGE